MKIVYVDHSCFTVELDSCSIIFDYYKGELPILPYDRPVYVFSSHAHHDHFTNDIFRLAQQYKQVIYILSDDIQVNNILANKNEHERYHIYSIGAYERMKIGRLEIETLKSTDEGVAFLIRADKKNIYHAGDLNWWHWQGEPEEWNAKMEQDFKFEIQKLAPVHLDCAFLPLDPRQEDSYDLGMRYFLEKVETKYVLPMHCWGDYSVIEKLRTSYPQYQDKVLSITSLGQSWEI